MKWQKILKSQSWISSPFSFGQTKAKPTGAFSSTPLRKTAKPSPSDESKSRPESLQQYSGSASTSSSDEMVSPSDKSSEISPDVLELQKVFRIFDTDGDGKISASELGSVLRSLGDFPSEEELLLMVKEADSDGDGYVDFEEFLKLNRGASKEEELKAAFRVFDIDKNGLISADELYRVLIGMGEKELSMEACYRMIEGVDNDGDGSVSFEEFQSMMTTGLC